MHQIHIRQQPGRSRAAILAASGLLVLCLALAGSLVWSRSLAGPVQVPGWAITFRPPRGWKNQGLTIEGNRETMTLRERSAGRSARRFSVSRCPARPDRSPEELCFDQVRQLVGWVDSVRLLASFGRPERAPLGHLPGARMIIPGGAYVHVGLLPTPGAANELYVLELHSERPFRLGNVLAAAVRPGE